MTDTTNDVQGIAAAQLKSIIERIERLEAERKGIADDIKDIYAESKGLGFDNKIVRQIIKLRAMDTSDRQEQETLLDLYKAAVGME